MLNCKEFTHQSSKMIDQAEMSFLEKFNCRLHLFLCKHCQHYHEQAQTVVSVANHLECTDASEHKIDEAVAKMKNMQDS